MSHSWRMNFPSLGEVDEDARFYELKIECYELKPYC